MFMELFICMVKTLHLAVIRLNYGIYPASLPVLLEKTP